MGSPECYIAYPYYFPDMKFIDYTWWLPVDPPPIVPERRLVLHHTPKWDMIMGVCEVWHHNLYPAVQLLLNDRSPSR